VGSGGNFQQRFSVQGSMRRISLFGVASLALLASGCFGSSQVQTEPSDPRLANDLRAAQRFSGYPLYWARMDLGKLPLTHVGVYNDRYSFSYGTCSASGEEGGCVPPMEIQTTDLCNRLPKNVGVTLWPRRLRGALVSDAEAGSDNGGALSLYVQGATITIYGWNRKLDLAAVKALRGANRLAPVLLAGQPLPAASAREVAGLGC
jgi:hypothetical protein